jgi:hypothetical protein
VVVQVLAQSRADLAAETSLVSLGCLLELGSEPGLHEDVIVVALAAFSSVSSVLYILQVYRAR